MCIYICAGDQDVVSLLFFWSSNDVVLYRIYTRNQKNCGGTCLQNTQRGSATEAEEQST